MKVLICGDRDWTAVSRLYQVMSSVHCQSPISAVVEGGARGADLIGCRWATDHGILVIEYKADWIRQGRAAGPIINLDMLRIEKPDVVYAFHDDLSKSKGTKHMVRESLKAGVIVHHVTRSDIFVLKKPGDFQ